MISKKALYAIRALMSLARVAPEAMNTGEIVLANDLPRKFLEAILLDLKRARITVSERGREGGHRLARAPGEINLADIIRAIDGPLAMLPCASVTSYRPCDDCPDVENCQIRRALAKGRDALAEVLESTTLADLVERPDMAPAGVFV
ncbi:Rrf2 family transcriptional regulator [Phenylobacterium sp.]|uniref:RrF2 family transcriptional regulator n=1 Tax=Phenylobacterium sp. TaxID=1871053 RepID=UPI00272F23AE|nr:Rrf2 family transcriptional regulator [Phenylobacterium sp.]MDP1618111.1 Rrf2 family transcriptional regulator [Phenylobacterium sp.]MDP1986464.1 Rrf2 family transcriptional regulator [Phenylobacterium sp.]